MPSALLAGNARRHHVVPNAQNSAASEASPLRRSRVRGSRVRSNGTLAGAVENSNFLHEASAEHIALLFEIEARLQVEPKPLGRAEVPCEPECRPARRNKPATGR
jgi:hypothetical protein